MKKHLQRILSLLCVLALAIGMASAFAEDPAVQYEAHVIMIKWMDSDNYDGIRPDHVDVSLAGRKATLNEANGWTGEVSVPAGTGNGWTYDEIPGYTAVLTSGDISVLTYSHAVAPTISVSGTVVWDDSDNAGKLRPESVMLMLLADGEPSGEPLTAKDPAWKVTWDKLPKRRPNADTDITYTVQEVQVPAGYTASVSGLEVKNTLQLAGLKLTAALSGAPEGTDFSGLTLTVDGADPKMPVTLTWDQLTDGSYDFGSVLPGAYLVRGTNADGLVEDYTMDPENTTVADAVYVSAGETATLSFKYAWKQPEAIDAEEDYDPLANIGNLTFEILGPDSRMPMTLRYSDFKDGKYELPDLVPGVYTVVERNAETLVKYYTLTGASLTGMVLTVSPDGFTSVKLFNQYTPAPTPEPDAEFVDIPVTKTWNDNGDKDGNRPESITVRLYADGVEVDSHVLTEAEGWAFTFTDKPRYKEDHRTEIAYTVSEDAVAMYEVEINGYNIVNNYHPEVTSRSVAKIWIDNDDAQKIRPLSIAMSLSDGTKVVAVVILNEENNWSATVDNLPTVVDGKPAVYTWKEQDVLGYNLTGAEEQNGVMVFTNTVWKRPDQPNKGKKPKTPGDVFTIEDYDTPLGVEIIINHVGDCFD